MRYPFWKVPGRNLIATLISRQAGLGFISAARSLGHVSFPIWLVAPRRYFLAEKGEGVVAPGVSGLQISGSKDLRTTVPREEWFGSQAPLTVVILCR